jgi:hypothetical protein
MISTYPSFTVPYYEHKAISEPSQVFAFIVQCPQTNAILLKTIHKVPFFAKL